MTAASSLLQPRIAVVLGVSERWHLLLFACRLLSTAPAIWWGAPVALRLVARLHLLVAVTLGDARLSKWSQAEDAAADGRLWLTETSLAIIWCGASAYLSFFFTDCLMSRWLVNYTPQATVVRLLTINALNGYLTSWVLYLTGGSDDPRLFLPAWIAIATTLTMLYHITQRKINIRKETSISISVFSIASFISMVALLAYLHSNRPDRPDVPLISVTSRAWRKAGDLAARALEYAQPRAVA